MTELQAPPAHRTLASELRWVRANLPDETPQAVTRNLDAAIIRAETEADQARIWRGEAEQRETAVAQLARVHVAVAALDTQLAPGDTGERWVLDQIRHALKEER